MNNDQNGISMTDLDYLLKFIEEEKFSPDVKAALKKYVLLELRSDAPLSEYSKIINEKFDN